jgi:hypothetical protein
MSYNHVRFFENHGYIYIYLYPKWIDNGALVSANDMSKYGASWVSVIVFVQQTFVFMVPIVHM